VSISRTFTVAEAPYTQTHAKRLSHRHVGRADTHFPIDMTLSTHDLFTHSQPHPLFHAGHRHRCSLCHSPSPLSLQFAPQTASHTLQASRPLQDCDGKVQWDDFMEFVINSGMIGQGAVDGTVVFYISFLGIWKIFVIFDMLSLEMRMSV
jgi:hypothetical protein